jgi:hypothetical protein
MNCFVREDLDFEIEQNDEEFKVFIRVMVNLKISRFN